MQPQCQAIERLFISLFSGFFQGGASTTPGNMGKIRVGTWLVLLTIGWSGKVGQWQAGFA
jgi:hypothetical protein